MGFALRNGAEARLEARRRRLAGGMAFAERAPPASCPIGRPRFVQQILFRFSSLFLRSMPKGVSWHKETWRSHFTPTKKRGTKHAWPAATSLRSMRRRVSFSANASPNSPKGEDGASDDGAWTKPHIDEGLAALDRGEFVSLEEHKAHNSALLAFLKA